MVRLSVVVPNYNHSSFIKKRLSSLLQQMSAYDELIVVDNASTDSSKKVLKEMTKNEKRLRLLENAHNQGPIPSCNRGIDVARGEFITILSMDDTALPTFVEETLSFFIKHPELAIVFSERATSVDGTDNAMAYAPMIPSLKEPTLLTPQTFVDVARRYSLSLQGQNAILRREEVLHFGKFNPQFGCFCDWALMHTIACKKPIGFIPKVLTIYRDAPVGYSYSSKKNRKLRASLSMNILNFLSQQEASLMKSLKRSSLLHGHIRSNLLSLLKRPKYWHFYFPFIRHYIAYRMRKVAFWRNA